MTYVATDLFGNADLFEKLKKKIRFGEKDFMFVLGNMVDFGEQTADLLLELSYADNVWPIAGRRERTACRMLSGFEKMLSEGGTPDPDFIAEMQAWNSDGGDATLSGFRSLDHEMREGILEYLSDMPAYEPVTVRGKDYLLVAEGITGYKNGTAPEDYPDGAFFGDNPVTEIDGFVTLASAGTDGTGVSDGERSPGKRLYALRLEDMKRYVIE